MVTEGVITDWYTNRQWLIFGSGPGTSNFSNVMELRGDGQYSTGDFWELRYMDSSKTRLQYRTYSLGWSGESWDGIAPQKVVENRILTVPLSCAIGQFTGEGKNGFTERTAISAEVATLP
jgi:hypothetical protein